MISIIEGTGNVRLSIIIEEGTYVEGDVAGDDDGGVGSTKKWEIEGRKGKKQVSRL